MQAFTRKARLVEGGEETLFVLNGTELQPMAADVELTTQHGNKENRFNTSQQL